jgi:HEAT repeat protein
VSEVRCQVSESHRRQPSDLVRVWARPIASTFLALWLTPLAYAQSPRLPEPVPSSAAQMFEQLSSDDWILQAEALDYLSRYNVPDTAGPVNAILVNDRANRWLRSRALVALSRIESANAADFAATYSTDPIVELRAASAEICYELPADKAAPIIQALLADKTPLVKFNALAAHARHQGTDAWEISEPVMANVPANCIAPAARALGWIGTEPAMAKLRELSRQGGSVPALLRGLDGVENPALAPFYLDLLVVSPVADIWRGMQGCGDAAVNTACQDALASGDSKQVMTVARLMTRFARDPGLGDALQVAILKESNPATLQVGLAALSCVGADRYRDLFVANLSHTNTPVRLLAINCLAQCKEINLYERLESALADPDASVRVDALRSLQHASPADVPQERVVDYFESSLMSKDKATREAAMSAIAPSINMDNGEAALEVLKKIQRQYGADGTETLMHAVFRMVSEENAAAVLETHGYVTRWHVVGTFPSGFDAPGEDIDGLATAYPPEQKIDLNQSFTVVYNSQGDKRFAKKPAERVIGWVQATVANADGIVYLTKAGRSQLQPPNRTGAGYAFTEISLPRQTDLQMSFLLHSKSQSRVWLNGKELSLTSKAQGKDPRVLKTAKATLKAGKSRFLVKVVTADGASQGWGAGDTRQMFRLSLTDPSGKPVGWSYE